MAPVLVQAAWVGDLHRNATVLAAVRVVAEHAPNVDGRRLFGAGLRQGVVRIGVSMVSGVAGMVRVVWWVGRCDYQGRGAGGNE